MEKRRNCSKGAISPLFHNILLPVGRSLCSNGTRFLLRDKWLFEISEFEITRVDCIDRVVQGRPRSRSMTSQGTEISRKGEHTDKIKQQN